jgi:hypothetical protein
VHHRTMMHGAAASLQQQSSPNKSGVAAASRSINTMLTKNLLQDDAVEPVTHWHAHPLSLHCTSPNLQRRVNVGRSKDRALFLEHFLPDGNEPPPGSSNSSHRKEIDADSLEGRAKAFERKRYVSICRTSSQTLRLFRVLKPSSGELLHVHDRQERAAFHAEQLGHGQHPRRRRP